ncbi:MAG: class B sortase [Lachnospiraceae bacterium]|nr:class B sortase [Lachnospiraceae bacterium]
MNTVRKILFVCLAVICLGAIGFGGYYIVSQQSREKNYENLTQEVHTTSAPEEKQETQSPPDTVEPTATPEPTATVEPLVIPIDFTKLQAENPDIYAWIQIPDTKVDDPIAQSATDNSYYLNHTVAGDSGLPGSIYTENINKKDFSDNNTVIYGHNMRDGSMFGGLSQYMDSAYMQAHPQIIIYTPEHRYTYQVFGGITYDDRHIPATYNCQDLTQFQAFLDSLSGVRNMQTYLNSDLTVTTADRILTLSTCTSNSQERFLVEAVLVHEE